ncbi:MAG: hypothetical protein NC818_05060 [Candidatus Omnitrophica bacterium]|nr:hypothetical protein [Candidatus Omnitrophota bacterium]
MFNEIIIFNKISLEMYFLSLRITKRKGHIIKNINCIFISVPNPKLKPKRILNLRFLKLSVFKRKKVVRITALVSGKSIPYCLDNPNIAG